jgi:uncharacterized protein (TIGR03000 family)
MRALIVAILTGVGLVLVTSASAQAEAPADAAPVVITMLVPADAVVSIDGAKTTQTGTLRRFYSPPVAKGKTFKYQIDVVADGQEMVNRKLTVQAGERITLDCRGGQVRETRGTGSSFYDPEAAGTPAPFVPSPAIGPRVAPFGNSSPANSPWAPIG